MSGFLYFLAGHKTGPINASVLDSYGLSHIGDSTELISGQVLANGPDGQAGHIVGHRENWKTTEVKQTPQIRWQKCPIIPPSETEPKYKQGYVGYLPDKPLPKPDDLLRAEQVPSHPTTMHDGSVWLLPIARDLPRVFGVDAETGALTTKQVQPKHSRIWELQQDWLEFHSAEPEGAYGRYDELVAVCFGANYRVGLVELSLLGCLGDGFVDKVIYTLLDIPGEDILKKSADLDIGDTSDGAAKSQPDSPATMPPA